MSDVAGAAISGTLGLVSGIIGNRSQTKNVKRQIKAQQEENAKTREFNQMLAKQQNAWNVEQYEREQQDYLSNWNRQNEYDAPTAQMARLKAAGLNPNLALGSMSDSGTISTSSAAGSMTGGAPATSADMSALGRLPTIGDAMQSGLDAAMKGAQIDAIKAQTSKVREETTGISLDNKVKASTVEIEMALKQGELTMKNLEIKGLEFDVNSLKPEQLKLLTSNINKMSVESEQIVANINKTKSEIANVDVDTAIKKIESIMKGPMMLAQIKQLSASAGLSIQQAREIGTLLPMKLLGLEKGNQLLDEQINNAKGQYKKFLQEVRGMQIDNDRLQLEFNADRSYLEYKGDSFLNAVGNLLSGLTKAIPLSFK